MKNKTRRFSKSAFSVILALCMLLSCLTVGVIPTGAANVEGGSTGASSTYTVYFRNNGSWSNVYVLTGSNLNMSGSSGAYENLYGSNINTFTEMSLVPGETNVYKASVTVYDNKIAFASANSTQSGYYASSGQICCVGDMSSGKVVNMWTDNWTSRNGAAYKKYNLDDYTPPTPNITGINGDWSTGDGMTYDSGNDYYYAFTGDGSDKFFRFKFNSKYYEAYADGFNLETGSGGPYDGSSDSKKYVAREGNGNAFKLTASTDYNYRIYFDISGKKTWFTKTERTHSVAIKRQLGSGSATNVSTATIGNVTGVNVTANETVTSGSNSYTFDHWAISGGTVSISTSQNGTYTSKAAGTTYSTRNIYVKTASDSAVLTAVYTLNLQALSAPTNVTLSSSTVTAAPSGSVTLSWSSVSNAGSYKIYLGDNLVTTVTGTSYSIEKKYSNRGTYKVVAVPSNTNNYSESAKSSGVTLTVNRSQLPAPDVSISPTSIAAGGSTTATFSNYSSSLSSYITNGYATLIRGTRAYEATGGAFVTNTAVTSTTGSESLSPTSNIQYGYYMSVTTAGSEYYTQSGNSSFFDVAVYTPAYYLVGDLVDSTNNKWNTSLKDYPVDIFVSANVFKRVVTFASGGTNDKHYFRLNNGTNQYTVTSDTDTDMSTHTTSATAVTASTATTSGSMYVTGQGTYTIYVNQSNKKVWVEKTEAQKYTTIVYVNKDSDATRLYVWKDANNAVSPWPGEVITTTEETVNDIPYYKYTFESYWDHFDIVVNKGDDQHKSADLTNIAASNTYYVTWDGVHMTPPSISTTAPVIQLGYKIGENGTVTHADFTNRSVSVTLAANTTYEFWLKSANSHLNDQGNGTMTRANCTNWSFPVNNTNTKIQTDLAGTYTFTYTVSNGNISVSVTYPPEPKYNVTVNQGDHGTVKVNGSNFTTGGTIEVGSLTTASIEAVAASGYHFTGWTTSGGVAAVSGYTTSSNPITISASAQGMITATYAENSYTLTLASGGNGSITTPSSKTLTVHPITATSLSGVTVTPANGYKFNGWTAGEGVTLTDGSTSSPSTGTVKATQDSTLTAEFIKDSYTLTGETSLNGTVGSYGSVTFYSDADCNNQITTAQIGETVYAKFTSSDYALVSFTKDGMGSSGGTTDGNVYSFTMGYANTTVTAAVRAQHSITYYVDMHDNTVNSLSFAVVTDNNGTDIAKDGNGNNCSATLGDNNLKKQGNSTVYAATINTPITLSGSTYSDLFIRITFNGTNYTKKISGGNISATPCIVRDLINSREIWFEAENESSQSLSVQYSSTFSPESGSTPAVAEGYRRIYLAKPFSWETSEPNWKHLKVYHWGNYNDMGWNNGVGMTYLGYGKMPGADSNATDVYHYYYIDLPKYLNQDRTLNTDGTGNKVKNIIFQGWVDNGSSPSAQTGNIENIPDSANFYILSKDGSSYIGTASDSSVLVPTYARHAISAAMNTGQTGVNIAPARVGAKVTYNSSNSNKVSVSETGDITAVASTVSEPDGVVTVTVKVYGSIGAMIGDTSNGGGNPQNGADVVTYTVSVSVHDPSQFNGFEIMSLESKTYTVNIPAVSGNQPGYFDMSNVVMTVEGIHGVASSTSSAIITQTSTTSVTGVGTVCTAFTVQYAKANSLFENYGDINIIGKVTTKSIARSGGQRYGHESWEVDGETEYFTTSRTIANSVETATTNGIPFDDSKTTYSAVFVPYVYVDVTFTFNYYEYNPEVDDNGTPEDTSDDMINYPYDATWAGNENPSNANFAASHTLKTYTVSNYEVRYKTADNITTTDLANAAATAIGVRPSNNYYNYSIAAANTTKTKTGTYNVTSTVNMTQTVRHYSVYLNGSTVVGTNYTYQQYAEPTIGTASKWYAVDERYATVVTNAPLLATGTSYKFRVKGDTYLRTVSGTTGVEDLRSEVDFSHFEIIHRENTNQELVDYLLQNFYIADFFSPSKVLDPNSNNGQGNLPYDDAQFVGGGVVYYSMNGVTDNNPGTPFANAVSSGYVNGDTGEANAAAIKEMLKANIEAYHSDDVSRALGEEEAMKIAYGTEIKATKNVEGGFNTGIIYRYLPMNQYKRNGAGEQTVDIELTSGENIWTPSEEYDNKWAVTSGNNGSDTAPSGQRTVRFVNNQGWDVVCVHYWGGSKASYWPGIKMIAVEGQDNVYEAVIPADSTHVVFSDGGYMPETNANGEYTLKKDVNSNTFRYSNTLQSYQYVYASGNENKATNAGKNMRLYSYYVYSYVAYNQETNVPETRYEIVLSDNYSDASTYWGGSNN